MKNTRHLLIGFLVILAGCEAIPKLPTGPRTLVLHGESYTETTLGPFITWRCRERYSYSGVLVEVGIYEKAELAGVGFVLFDGSDTGETALYSRQGLERRWDWGPNSSDYSVVISPDGGGAYYDFTNVEAGKSIRPKDGFDCSQ